VSLELFLSTPLAQERTLVVGTSQLNVLASVLEKAANRTREPAAMESRSSPCLLVLVALTVAHAMVTAAAPATTGVTAEAPGHRYELLSRNYETLAPPPGKDIPRVAVDCVKTALETSRPCARDVLLTLVFGSVHLSQGCCHVFAGIGQKCVADVFATVPQIGHALLPVVNSVCGFVATIL
jgi:hypothetical protein